MKGRWESSINVWSSFTYAQKLNCYFQNRIIMFCLPVLALIYLWEIYVYIFPGSGLFCCNEICGPILGKYKLPTDTWMCGHWDWGRAIPREGIHKWNFPCSVLSAQRFLRELLGSFIAGTEDRRRRKEYLKYRFWTWKGSKTAPMQGRGKYGYSLNNWVHSHAPSIRSHRGTYHSQ